MGLVCSGQCSKHPNPLDTLLRSALLHPYFVDKELRLGELIPDPALQPRTEPLTLPPGLPAGSGPHLPTPSPQDVTTGQSCSMSMWASGSWTYSTRRSLTPTAGAASPSTWPR